MTDKNGVERKLELEGLTLEQVEKKLSGKEWRVVCKDGVWLTVAKTMSPKRYNLRTEGNVVVGVTRG